MPGKYGWIIQSLGFGGLPRPMIAPMFGADLAKLFDAQHCEFQLLEAHGEPEFAVTRLRSDANRRVEGVCLPRDEGFLLWVSLTPTAISQWRAQYNGREVGVTRSSAFATTALDLRCPTRMWSRGPFDVLHCFIAASLLERVALENEISSGADFRAAFFVEDYLVAQLARSMLLPAWQAESFDNRALGQVAMLLSAHLLQRYCGSTQITMRRGLRTWQKIRAEELLRSRLERNVTVAELAAACSVSVSHFARGFRRSFGLSAHQYLIRLRLERAKALLTGTTKPLAEIAHLCGFCDQAAFTRTFARAERMAPSLWRRCNT